MSRVVAAPFLDPGRSRVDLTLPEGLTVAEIVATALPGLSPAEIGRTRVALVTERGSAIVPAAKWARVRPKAHASVVIRIVPGDDLLGILSIVVSIAAIALGQLWLGPLLASTLGITSAAGIAGVSAVATAGLTALGGFLVNLLVPPPKQSQEKPSYAISGFRNTANPDGPVPQLLGKRRIAPPFAIASYTEVVGDLQYVRAVFGVYGPIEITDIKIGDTPIGDYDEVEWEVRQGFADDAPLTLVTNQVIERSYGVELRREVPKNDFGEPTGAPSVDQPVKRNTVRDVTGYRYIFSMPAGLIYVDKKGNRNPTGVILRLRERLAGSSSWTTVETIIIRGKKQEGFFRAYERTVPVRGAYETEIVRVNDNVEPSKNHTVVDRVVLAGLQSIRPEYPIDFDAPLALLAVRIKATYQLNSALDQINFVGRTICLDWDAATNAWVLRGTNNPASLFRHVLQGMANAKRVGDGRIDLAALAEWHVFCEEKGLAYNRFHDFDGSVEETLIAVAAAGRASPRDDGTKWSVVIDRPQPVPVDHVSPRNAREMSWSERPFTPPHGFRVPFNDETNDYQAAERIVRWPGYEGPITQTEGLALPHVTDPDQVFVETFRRMLELIHRQLKVYAIQDGASRVSTRGDRVAVSMDMLDRAQKAARVRAVRDQSIAFDDTATMEEGGEYAIRFRAGVSEADPLGRSVVRRVLTVPGAVSGVSLLGLGETPVAGDLVLFGTHAAESFDMVVRAVEPAEDFAGRLHFLPHAPQIDEILDATPIPPWDGRAGGEIIVVEGTPAVPRFTSISSGVAGAGASGEIVVGLAPGAGSNVTVAKYQLRRRLSGSPTWIEQTAVPAASAGDSVSAYANGSSVEVAARALSPAGTPSDWTATVTVIVGSGDQPLPSALPPSGITVLGGPGRITVGFVRDADPGTRRVRIYANQTGTLNRATDLKHEIVADPGAAYSRFIGDPFTANELTALTLGAGWTLSGGVYTHASGSGSTYIAQAKTVAVGDVWRFGFAISGRTNGNVFAALKGTTDVRTAAITTNGPQLARLTAIAGITEVGFFGGNLFDGSVTLTGGAFKETPASLAQGSWYVWMEPFNDDDVAGPVSTISPVTVY